MRKKFTFWNSKEGRLKTMDKNIFEIQRFATISNSANNTVITGTADADSIYNEGANVTIKAGDGNNTIRSSSSDTSIITGIGSDRIYNTGSFSTIDAGNGNGNDRITNSGSNVSVNAGEGNNYIYNASGDNVTITAGNGNNTISSDWYGTTPQKNLSIKTGSGDDSVFNCFSSSKIDVGNGNNRISNSGSDTSIKVGDGNDSFSNSGSNVTIDSGAGNDSVSNSGANVKINAGAGDDYINNSGRDTSIIAGAGNDSIDNYGVNVTIDAGDGDDYICNNHYNGSLNANVTIDAGDGNNTIENGYCDSSIIAGAGNDSISNSGANVKINAGAGDDSIDNRGGKNVTINAGLGNDSITLLPHHNFFTGVYDYYGSAIIQYAKGDGNDYIKGFDSSDTLIVTGAGYATSSNDTDVFVRVDNETITLAGAADKTLHINGTLISGSNLNNTVDGKHLTGTAHSDTLYNSGKKLSIEGGRYDDIIANSGSNVTIYGGTENDSVTNSGENVKIFAGDGDDSIINRGANVTIDGGAGSDRISNEADSVEILGGSDDDSINNTGKYAYINGGEGNDSIYNNGVGSNITAGNGNNLIINYGSDTKIISGSDADTISNNASNVTIDGGAGNDTISNSGNKVRINAGDGNDSISNDVSNVMIDAGAGNDSIRSYGFNVTIDAGSGHDTIISNAASVQIYGGAGADYISLDSVKENTVEGGTDNDTIYFTSSSVSGSNVYRYSVGDGNDDIYNMGSSDTILIAAESFSTVPLGNDIIINVGEGSLHLYDAANKNVTVKIDNSKKIYGTEGADSINNTVRGATITALGGKDTIHNNAENVKIYGGNDDDYIQNGGYYSDYNKKEGSFVTINAGAGDDTIENYYGSDSSIIAGAGNDSIYNHYGDNVTIDGGAGNDTIYNNNAENIKIYGGNDNDYIATNGDNVTINAGAGNDTIANSFSDNVSIDGGEGNDYIYNDGGDNVTINGGAGNDTISADYSTRSVDTAVYQYSDGDGNDVIEGFRAQDTLQILDGVIKDWAISDDDVVIKIGDGSIRLKNSRYAHVTVLDADGKLSTINNDWTTITGTANADNIYNTANNMTISALGGNDTIYNSGGGKASKIYGDGGDDSIRNWGEDVQIFTGDGNDDIYNQGENTTINGGAGDDYISTHVSNVKIEGGAGDDTISNTGDDVTVDCGDGNDYVRIVTSADNMTISTGTGNDTIYYRFGSNITLLDFDKEDTIVFSTAVEEMRFDEETKILTIDDVPLFYLPNSTSAATWKVEGFAVSYMPEQNLKFILAKDGKSITCTGTATASALTITGLKNDLTVVDGKIDGITLEDKKVTVSETVLEGKDVTITEGYELALSDEVKAPEKSVASWSVSNGTAKYKDGDTTAGYVVEDGKIVYKPASVGETLITIEGLSADATTDGISLTDKTVTLSESVLDKKEGTISEGYTLALADDVITPKTGEPSWSIADNIATYKAGDTTAGYILSDNKISYEESKVGENIFTVSGVKSLEGLTLNEKVITVAESALNESEVTIDGEGYSLAIANDVDSPVINSASWSVTNGTATCQGSRTAGYTLENNKIIYHAAVTDEALITVTGLKDDAQISGISLNGTTVTLSESVLDEKETTISAGYTLALADDVTKTTTGAGSWSIANDTATYKAGDVTAGYSVTDNKIAYASAKVGENLVTVNGVKSVDGLTLKDKVVTVAESSLDEKEVSISNDYTLALASGVSKPTATNPAWTVTNGTATYRLSGKTEGYTLDNGKILYSTAVEGETSITISGLKNTATATNISLNNDTLNIANAAIGTGTITVTAPDSVKKVTVGGAGNFTFDGQTFSVDTAAEFTLDSNKVNGYKVTGNGAAHLNNTYSNLTITGGNGADVISVSGSGSQNTVIGSGGNDTLYSNGSSNVFQYTSGAGNDVIYNLGNKDTVQVASGNVDSIYAEKGGDVIVTVGANKITLKNRAGQTITVKNAAGTVTSQSYTYTEPAKPSTPTPATPSTPSTPSTPAIPSTPSTPSTNTTTRTTTTTTPSTTPSSSSSSASTTSSSSGSSSSSSSTRTPSSSSSSSSWSSGSSSGSTTRTTTTSPTTTRSSSSSGGSTSRSTSSSSSSSASSGSLSSTTTTQTQATSTPIQKSEDGSYDYTGGNKTVSNYTAEDKVKLSSDFAGIDVSGNNFVIKSSSGALTLENVRDQVINVTDSEGNTAAYVYMASGGGDIDGSSLDTFEVIVGSEAESNNIKAGNGGSSLVGGGGDNTLQGGNGQDTFKYSGGTNVITNYQSGELLNFAATYTGWTTDGNDLVINAAEGSVRISEATDKLVSLADANGNLLAYVYKSGEYEGAIDGRSFGTFEVIVGSDNASNQIFAGEIGSSLWGGRGSSNDDLYGNIGVDEYVYSYGNGQDNIYQAGSEDTTNLLNISLDHISSAEILDNGVNLKFTDGGSLNISGQVGNFKLEGQVYHADYQNKTWS